MQPPSPPFCFWWPPATKINIVPSNAWCIEWHLWTHLTLSNWPKELLLGQDCISLLLTAWQGLWMYICSNISGRGQLQAAKGRSRARFLPQLTKQHAKPKPEDLLPEALIRIYYVSHKINMVMKTVFTVALKPMSISSCFL